VRNLLARHLVQMGRPILTAGN